MARILVVDDDKDILNLCDRLLGRAGYQVVGAENAVKAMQLLMAYDFNLLITDINLPRYSGFDLLTKIHSTPRFSHLKVAMLTGRRDREDVDRAIEAGVEEYIVKPLDPILLLKKVDGLLTASIPPLNPPAAQPVTAATSRLSFEIQINSVDEFGVVLESAVQLTDGSMVNLEEVVFEGLVIPQLPIKILQSQRSPSSKGRWLLKGRFEDHTGQTQRRIHAWLIKNQVARPLRA